MAKELNEITFKNALNFLNNGNVLNYFKKNNLNKKINIFQLVKNEKYYYYYFDFFGNKIEAKSKEISEKELKEYILNPSKFNFYHHKGYWSYHKKRISKKKINPNINNEEDLKKIAYKWLLNLNKNLIIIPEFTIKNRRVDYIAFDKTETYLIELKSEIDTLNRLEEQLKAYQLIGNYIYLIIHEIKFKKINEINIPKNVGIFVVKNNKMKLVKKVIKNKINFSIFKTYISYVEYMNIVKGLKNSSKLSKEQIIDLIDKNFTKKEKDFLFYKIICKRYIFESNKRKEAWKQKKYKEALGKSSLLGINRMKIIKYKFCTLKKFFNLKEEIILDYLKN